MKKIKTIALSALLSSLFAPLANANAVYTSATPDHIFGGYPDHSITFNPVEGTVNPAGCAQTGAYAMLPSYDTQAALLILLEAKREGKRVYFSVRDDICHTLQQTDDSSSYPVIQRIAIR